MQKFIMIVVVACLSQWGCSTGDPSRVADIAALQGDINAGGLLFAMHCAGCHGDDGSGGSGPDLREHAGDEEQDELIDVILNGDGAMPGFSNLADQEVADLVSFLGSL